MDTTKQIKELYLAFAKSQSQIDELYEKLPFLFAGYLVNKNNYTIHLSF